MRTTLNNYTFSHIPVPEAIETPNRYLAVLVSDLRNGHMRIPDFQREFVWGIEQVEQLLDSVQRGFPIGSILVWETSEKLNERDPLNLRHLELKKGDRRQYILDGQQRLVTLYEILHDMLQIGRGKRKTKYKVFYDLKKKEFRTIRNKDIDEGNEQGKIEDWFLDMKDLFVIDYATRSFRQNNDIVTKFSAYPELLGNYMELFVQFNSLNVPAITTGQNLSTACKIFERLNTTGTPLGVVDIMVAATYTRTFNLRDKLEEVNSDFERLSFELEQRTILQSISACLRKHTSRDDIIKSSEQMVGEWDKTTEAIRLSLDFLRRQCYVPVSRFLPNEIAIAPLSFFFYNFGNRQLSQEQTKKLKRYFWLCALSNRYGQSQDTHAAEDMVSMDDILKGTDDAKIFNFPVEFDMETIKNMDMSFGSAQAKTILCYLSSKIPLEFKNNNQVSLETSFADANNKQLHHIFPQNVIKNMYGKDEKPREFMNSVSNISLISQMTNRSIWDKKPSVYFSEFSRENPNLKIALNSHLIEDLDSFGLTGDKFELFIEKRSTALADDINNFVATLL